MKRFAAWAAWMTAAALAHGAQGHPAYVNFGYSGVSPTVAYRIDDECYVTTAMVSQWGWQVDRGDSGLIKVTVGDHVVGVQGRRVNGDYMLPVIAIARQLDA